MKGASRSRIWLAETHSANFELLRHFLSRFFDSEMSGAGEWQKVAIGIFAALVSFGIVAVRTYMERYDRMQDAGLSPVRILQEIRGHILERAEATGELTEDRLVGILKALGRPEDIAPLYQAEALMARARSSFSPTPASRTERVPGQLLTSAITDNRSCTRSAITVRL